MPMPKSMASRGDRKLTCLPANTNLTLVRLQEPEQDIHQGGFSSAILSENSVDFTRFHFKIDMIIGDDAGKYLGDPPGL